MRSIILMVGLMCFANTATAGTAAGGAGVGLFIQLMGMIASADVNHDRRIGPNEFQKLFAELDKNHDGYLDSSDRDVLLGIRGVAKK